MNSSSYGRRSLFASSTDSSLPVNDDAAEIQERKRQSELRRRESLILSPNRRNSTKDISLSVPEIFAHYTNCLKLSAENKINQKNAFHLQLIDFMSSMLKKKDARMENFQVASCALDASTKIYAARVDRVHSDGMKMAGSLCMLGKCKNNRKKAENEKECIENAVEGTKKVTRRRKERKVITDNSQSLDAPLVQNYQLHPSCLYMRKKFADCRPGSSNLLTRVEVYDDRCKLKFLHSENYFPKGWKNTDTYKAFPSIQGLKEMHIGSYSCEPADFAEGHDIADKGKISYMGLIPCSAASRFSEKVQTEITHNKINGEAEAECNGFCSDDDGEAEDDCQSAVGVAACISERPRDRIIDITKHLSAKPLEYSYFNMEQLQLWAGPSHWKLPRKQGAFVSKMKGRKGKKKVIVENIFDMVPNDIYKILALGGTIMLKKKTVRDTWESRKVTKELDVHYDTKNFQTLYFKKNTNILKFGRSNHDRDADDDFEDNLPVSEYINLNGKEDMDPNVHVDNNEEPPCTSNEDYVTCLQEVYNNDNEGNEKWNLLSPPPKVARIEIPFARAAKKIDIKKLKRIIWEILRRSPVIGENDSSSSSSISGTESLGNEDEMKSPMWASEMYEKLKSNVTGDLAKDLNFPIAFNCLLHLANDKKLLLTGKDDLSDIFVTQIRESS
ncbi:condensin complex subunit 2 [Schistocerca nitens]|uniref:condensin complex subunit 2 n=1 Tax=Schistocerca nitens TaxID=7011 RepID=UPI00211981FB|nr:condensin complex subunit 2 [Schistocerca nitens]